MKEFADDNFTFDENGIKLSKRVENTVGKGEMLVTSNFSFSHCFQKACFPGASKGVIVWERVKHLYNQPTDVEQCSPLQGYNSILIIPSKTVELTNEW